MLKPWQFWTLTALGIAAVILTAFNVTVQQGNLRIQEEITARQQFLQQSMQLENLYREIAQAAGTLAARNNDEALREMLAAQGITVTGTPQGR